MSILIKALNNPYQSTVSSLKAESRTTAGQAGIRSYDAITINSSPQKMESRFAKELTKALSADVRTEPSRERIEELTRQVQDGTYEISPQDIAARMLLLNGGVSNG